MNSEKAFTILEKIEEKEYPNRNKKNTNKQEDIFSVNDNIELTSLVYNDIMESRKGRRHFAHNSLQSDNTFDYSLNLFKDSNLSYYVNKANEGFATDYILPNARLRKIKILLNTLIRFHTRLQNYFNQNIISAFNILLNKLVAFYEQYSLDRKKIVAGINNLANEISAVEDKMIQFEEINQKVDKLQEGIMDLELKIKEATGIPAQSNEKKIEDIFSIKEKLSHIETIYPNLENWIKLIDERLTGQERWLSVVSKRIEDYEQNFDNLRKEIFYEMASITKSKSEIIIPKIINPKGYAEKVVKMDGKIKLQLGVGMVENELYVNIDMRELPSVDIIADILSLPFDNESVNEIFNAHLVEHFRSIDLKNKIFPYWYQLLEKGGRLRLITPNAEAMIYEYTNQKTDFSTLTEIIFGGQEYNGNYHYTMLNIAELSKLLKDAGFSYIKVIEEQRKNGKCLEMELIATK